MKKGMNRNGSIFRKDTLSNRNAFKTTFRKSRGRSAVMKMYTNSMIRAANNPISSAGERFTNRAAQFFNLSRNECSVFFWTVWFMIVTTKESNFTQNARKISRKVAKLANKDKILV